MIPVSEALAAIRAACPTPRGSRQPLSAGLAGRVVMADVHAAVSLPPFSTSAMDGYAVRRAEMGGDPMPIAFRIAAGDPPQTLPPGSVAGIATGAPMPGGADAVVPVEDAREDADRLIAAPPSGDFIRPAGGDVQAGGLVAAAGATLTPAALAALAAAGCDHVMVADRPRVAVLATGSELVEPGRQLQPGQIYESNATALSAQVARANAELVSAAVVRDEPEATMKAFAAAIAASDVVVSSGGVSVGPHDHVKPAMAALGVREVFWRVAHKPGKPLWFGVAPSGALVFGLPGNPVSSLVCFELFVRTALETMTGAAQRQLPVARLAVPVRRLASRDHAVRCRLAPSPDGMLLHPQDVQDSHLIAHAAAADALALIAHGEGEAAAGDLVEYLPI